MKETPHIDKSVESLHKLDLIPAYPAFEGYHPFYSNLGAAISTIRNRAYEPVEAVRTGQIPFEEARRTLWIIIGRPATGKSYTRFVGTNYLQSNLKCQVTTHTWEAAERRAIALKKITTPPELPFTPDELVIASNYFIAMGFEKIKQSLVSVWEVPVMPAVLIEEQGNRLIGRNLGYWALHNLTGEIEKYIEIYNMVQRTDNPNFHPMSDDLKLPPLDIYVTGLIGGKWVHTFAWYYRAAMKSTFSRKDGRKVALFFGKINPLDRFIRNQYKKMKEDGASPLQLVELDKEFHKLRKELPDDLRVDSPDLDLNALREQQEACLLEYVLFKNYGLPSENVFIGFNNPTPEALGIADTSNLEERFAEIKRKYQTHSRLLKYL